MTYVTLVKDNRHFNVRHDDQGLRGRWLFSTWTFDDGTVVVTHVPFTHDVFERMRGDASALFRRGFGLFA